MTLTFSWIILSYLLGSVPFGYLIAKLCGVDILKVGSRQTGGTNVFRNVGKWQGVLSGFLDVSKGFLAVWGAQKLGLGPEIQVFGGLAAIAGHNWPCYLKFRGGRGIGTLLGAAFALNPIFFFYFLIPIIVAWRLWDGAVGTLLSFLIVIFLSLVYKMEFLTLFFSLALVLTLIIRMTGKTQEIELLPSKTRAIFYRLISDNPSGPRPFPRWKEKTK